MKTIIGAIALAIAVPAAAQTAPTGAQPGHSQHQQHVQGQQPGQPGQPQGQHKSCCKQVNGKLECQMMKGHGSQQPGQGQPQGHSGH